MEVRILALRLFTSGENSADAVCMFVCVHVLKTHLDGGADNEQCHKEEQP